MPRDDRDVLVYLAGVYWHDVRGTDRHLFDELALRMPAIWVDPPRSVIDPMRERDFARLRSLSRVEEVRPGVHRVSLLAPPFPTRAGMTVPTRWTLRGALGGVLSQLGVRVYGVVNTTPYVGFGVVKPAPGGRRLYYATDDYVAGAKLMGLSERVLRRAEARRTAEADVLAAVSSQITNRWQYLGKQTQVLPNGCDPCAFAKVETAPLPNDVTLRGPVAGLVGQISFRIDLRLLEAVADSGTALLLVGPVQRTTDRPRFERLVARSNVEWVGPKSFEDLPSYLRIIDVGLTPYTLSDFNRASFPLKTLEYLSAGRAVASSPLPAVQALGSPWVHTAKTPVEYAELVVALAKKPVTQTVLDQRQAFARQHSWANRAGAVLDLLGLS